MELMNRIALFSPLDAAAVALWLSAWLGVSWMIEHAPGGKPSVSTLMVRYRRDWMHELVTRNTRMFDAAILASLRQGTTFFASASMIAIGGGLALIGNTERLLGVARDLTLDTAPSIVWEIKIFAVLIVLTNAFLKFVWSHRLFGYCAIIMAAVPNDAGDAGAPAYAERAASLNIAAARSFNRGLRSIYFALGGLTWLLGAVPLLLGTAITLSVVWRREFASKSRLALMDDTGS